MGLVRRLWSREHTVLFLRQLVMFGPVWILIVDWTGQIQRPLSAQSKSMSASPRRPGQVLCFQLSDRSSRVLSAVSDWSIGSGLELGLNWS